MERHCATGLFRQGSAAETPSNAPPAAPPRKRRVVALVIAASMMVAGCGGNGATSDADQNAVGSPTPTSTLAPTTTLPPTAAPQSTNTPPAHTPTSPGHSSTPSPSPTPTPTSTPTSTPTLGEGSPTPRIEGACFVGAPPCTGTSLLTTRDDCCELSRSIAGPLPVGWCAQEDLDPVTLECTACNEPCEGRPTFTPTATPSPQPTPSPSTCDVTNPCPQGAYCELPTGVCATDLDPGTCVEVPIACFDVFQPVCGCDGLTYGNDCIRRGARVQKAFDGACPEEECRDACDCYATRTFATSCPLLCPNCGNFWTCEEGRCLEHCGMIPFDACDQLCSANDACAPDELCRKPVGQCAALGACGARPIGCPDVVDPVCGCDGQTYSNECDASNAGVAIEHRGGCAEVCGTFAGLNCTKGQFCEFPAASCAVADLGGRCLDVPDACPAVVDPVCGCDGLTYDNDCERQKAHVRLDRSGPCGSSE